MMNPRKPASPFGNMGQPQGGQSGGQYGANASPKGNAWGQQFKQQFGAPPGQMKDEWSQFKTDNGFGMGGSGMGGQPDMPSQAFGGGGFGMGGMGGQQAPAMPQQNPMQPQMQAWQGMRPQFGGGQPMDRMNMIRAWLAQRPRGLLGG
jgi:hypothetical protein